MTERCQRLRRSGGRAPPVLSRVHCLDGLLLSLSLLLQTHEQGLPAPSQGQVQERFHALAARRAAGEKLMLCLFFENTGK